MFAHVISGPFIHALVLGYGRTRAPSNIRLRGYATLAKISQFHPVSIPRTIIGRNFVKRMAPLK